MKGSPITQIMTVVGLFVLAGYALAAFFVIAAAALVVLLIIGGLVAVGVNRGVKHLRRRRRTPISIDLAPLAPGRAASVETSKKALTMMTSAPASSPHSIVDRFWRNTQVARADIFGASDPLPATGSREAGDMWPGFIGKDYRPGGLVLVANFPAGGTKPYAQTVRALRDVSFYELIAAFKASGADNRTAAFEALNAHVREAIPVWKMFKIIEVVLASGGVTLDDVALINLIPYRIAGNAQAAPFAVANAWQKCTRPALEALAPGRVAALGQASGRFLQKQWTTSPLFVFSRTVGDTYVHPSARVEATRMAASSGLPAPQQREASAASVVNRPKASKDSSKPAARTGSGGIVLGSQSPTSSSVHGRIQSVVARNPGLEIGELLPHLHRLDFSRHASNHVAGGKVTDKWLIDYIKGGLRRGYLSQS